MKNISVLIIDNFYKDPAVIRDMALKLNFRPKDGAMYPGGEAFSDELDWENVRQEIIGHLGLGNIETPLSGKNFMQGKFRLALKKDDKVRPDAVHQDAQLYSAIVYLAKNEHCFGGIGIYKCRLTGETAITRKWLEALRDLFQVDIQDAKFPELMRSYCNNWDNWEKIGELPMRYNRLIILMARCFHASTGIFGEDPESGRLTQHFEIYL